MKKYICIGFSVLFLLLFPTLAFAQSANSVTLPADQVVTHDYFAAGDTVHVSGTIHGDAYVAGQTVIIDGTVDGDVIAAARNLTVSGSAHNLRIAGQTISVRGKVTGNITAAGSSITISPSASVSGSLVAAAGNLNILSAIGKGAKITGNETTIAAPIHGDVSVSGADLSLQRSASISGNLTTTSDLAVKRDNGSSVSGEILQQDTQTPDTSAYSASMMRALTPILAVMKFAGFISTLLIALILILLIPTQLNNTALVLLKRPLSALGIGFLICFLTPLLLVIFFITIIGIPLAFVLFLLYLLILSLAKTVGVYAISRQVFGKQSMHPFLAFSITLVLYEFVLLIPIIGGLTAFIVFLMGIGAIVIEKREMITSSKLQIPNHK